MDGNYDIISIGFSLKGMCASKVAYQALLASGIKSSDTSTQTSIVMDATKRVRQLELPATVIKMVEAPIGSLKRELMAWYLLSPERLETFDPVFTPQGTVDFVQGVRAIIVNENVDRVTRFTLACYYCMEEVIFKMFNQYHLRSPCCSWCSVLHESTSPFVQFWLHAVLYKCSESGDHLELEGYNDGLQLALNEENDTAIRYFIDKADDENVGTIVLKWNLGLPVLRNFTTISPSTYCLLFYKLSKRQRVYEDYLYIHFLLKSLINWPYQCFLTERVLSLAELLKPFQVCDLIRMLINKIQNGEHWFNFHRLMAIFLELYANVDFDLHWEIFQIVRDLLILKNEHLINIILNKLSIKDKGKLLMDSRTSRTCFELIRQQEFQLLKMFIRDCVLHRKCILHGFKLNFLKNHQELIRYKSLDEIKKLEVGIQKFVKIVDKIDSEKRSLDEMAQ